MLYLFAASLLWAFSFGLIGSRLAGEDAPSVAAMRLLLAFLLFVPFLRAGLKRFGFFTALLLLLVGAVQFGCMYVAYMTAYGSLKGHQVGLMTTFTPLLVMLFSGIPRGRAQVVWLVACAHAVVGAAIAVESWSMKGGAWSGVMWIQLSNICFAAGQVAYRRLMRGVEGGRDWESLSIMYMGALLVALAWAIPRGFPMTLTLSVGQWLAVVYLGLIPAGLGFFLWNSGARRARAGQLAVMNNVKIPLAVLCSLLIFREQATPWRITVSLTLLATALVLVSIPRWSR
jgi:drug/metabolite transporter (DMT)-like permease